MSQKLKSLVFTALCCLLVAGTAYHYLPTSIKQSSIRFHTGVYCEIGQNTTKMAYVETKQAGEITVDVPNGFDNPEIKSLYVTNPKHTQKVVLLRLYFPLLGISPINYYELIVGTKNFSKHICPTSFQVPGSKDI